MDFNSMLKKTSKFDDLQKKLTKEEGSGGHEDERSWYPALDVNKNGQATIRFLPTTNGGKSPWIKRFFHSFKQNGNWYIDECPSTVDKFDECPVCDLNKKGWDNYTDEEKSRKRKVQYLSNILIVDDPKNPENNGKVFIFKFGQAIFNKIKVAMQPEFDDDVAFNPFDMMGGADFKLRIVKKDGYVNYDNSKFLDCGAMLGGDTDKMKAAWESQYLLDDDISEDKYKTFDEYKKRLDTVLGRSAPRKSAADLVEDEHVSSQPNAPTSETKEKPKTTAQVSTPTTTQEAQDELDFLNDLLGDD